MFSHIALLRGINVGGKNKLPMADLRALFTAVGCRDVQTYIQSGNVLFGVDSEAADQLPQILTTSIAERFSYRVPVILRTAQQLEAAVKNNPYIASGVPEDTLHLLFLADLPDPDSVSRLDPIRSAPDTFIVQGREIYLDLPHGVADTKLTNAYFDAKLGTVSTSRNWRTVTKLLELMGCGAST